MQAILLLKTLECNVWNQLFTRLLNVIVFTVCAHAAVFKFSFGVPSILHETENYF